VKNYLLLAILLFYPMELLASDKDQIRTIMAQQEKAWNNADLEAFMQAYWKSDKLMFIGKSGIKYGWQTTLDNYKKSYPDKDAMGELHFDIIQVEVVKDSAFVLGKWQLTRSKDILSGFYTLYWKKIAEQWMITIDHSS